LIAGADSDLVVASLVVKGDEEQRPSQIAEIIDSVVAARNRVLEGKSDLVQAAIGNTETPDKVVDQGNVFLMRLSSKDN
jgi:CO/xanthine dehydrogenase FAD-binding subunit